jgi:hypothetical protein
MLMVENLVPFEIWKTYTRADISVILGTIDANIRNGVFKPHGKDFVILFVTEKKTRDRVPYEDKLEGDKLAWDGQRSAKTDSLIVNHSSMNNELLLMYRASRQERKDFSFVYLGRIRYVSHLPGHPSHFTLKLVDLDAKPDPSDDRDKMLSEVVTGVEGSRTSSLTTRYERNRALREEAIARFGTRCSICGFDFAERYGELGQGFIEVHHLVPLSTTKIARETNPAKDLVVVCSNCHSMLHRSDPVLSPEELQGLLRI